MASEIRVDKINSLSGVGTVTLSPTGVDIAGITTAATLKATTGIVTTLTATTGIVTNFTANAVNIGIDTGVYGEDLVVTGNTRVTGITTFGDSDNPALMLNIDATSGLPAISIPDSIIHSGDTNTKIRFPAADTITAETGGTEKLRIDGNGLGIGTASSGATLHVHNESVNTYFKVTNNNGTRAFLGCESGEAVIYAQDDSGGNAELAFHTGGTEQFKMTTEGIAFPSGKGINFHNYGSGTNIDSNLLDDYEEGSFTFTKKGFSGGFDANYAIANQTGKYTKIGRQVLLKGGFSLSGNSGNIAPTDYFTVNVSSLPFAPDDTSSGHTGAQIFHQGTWWAYTSLGGGSNAKGSVIEVSGDYLSFYCTSVTGSPVRNSNEITFTISYTSS